MDCAHRLRTNYTLFSQSVKNPVSKRKSVYCFGLFFFLTMERMHYLTNKEAPTVLCSVVKHAGSGQSTKEVRGKHEPQAEQSTVGASLFVL